MCWDCRRDALGFSTVVRFLGFMSVVYICLQAQLELVSFNGEALSKSGNNSDNLTLIIMLVRHSPTRLTTIIANPNNNNKLTSTT